MSRLSGRCRRHHQGTCEGPILDAACTKHAAEWASMEAEWVRRDRAKAPTGTVTIPPFVAWLANESLYPNSINIDPGWYFNHEKCLTTLGPFTDPDDARVAGDGHNCVRAKRVQAKHSKTSTHCVRGHEYTDANTIRKVDGFRSCRECGKAQARAWRARRKARQVVAA